VKTTIIILSVVFIICLGAAGAGFLLYQYATTPTGTSETTVSVWIRPGQGFFETVTQLEEAGLIRHPKKFRWLAYLKGDERRIRAGEYMLSACMSPAAILEAMIRGETVVHKVVVPEGATMVKIARTLAKAGLVSEETFLRAASEGGLIQTLGLEGDTLEGYLFPETYHFPKGVTAEQIIKKMVAQFRSVFTAEWADKARTKGLTTPEVVTLASIVEKETAKPEERPLIAAVFLNRLKRNMRLESDPTVIYGIKNFDGNLTRKDLKTLTPYNTYQARGLPPGPIANPGRASIEAVLYPSAEPYLYFVSKNDGSHHFSRTLQEHNRMVRRYQLRRQ
jgi:UPF0755 protein